MGEDLLTGTGGGSERLKWSGKRHAVHVLDIPGVVALDAPTDLHVACYGNEGVASDFKMLQCDCLPRSLNYGLASAVRFGTLRLLSLCL
jgi:hypothetical protein